MSPNPPNKPEPNILVFLSNISADLQSIADGLKPFASTNKGLGEVQKALLILKEKVDNQKSSVEKQKRLPSSYDRDKSLLKKIQNKFNRKNRYK